MQEVVFGTQGGQKQRLDVWFPAGHDPASGVKRPVVLCIHGGAWRQGDKKDMAPFAQQLARNGMVAVSAGYRLYSPEKPENVWPAQYDDAQLAVRWVRSHAAELGIDPDKLAAMGASAGGHLVALLGTTETRDRTLPLADVSSRVNAVIDLFGPVDLTPDFSALKPGGPQVQKLVDDFLGAAKPADERKRAAREASPLFVVDDKTVPFFIFHGSADPLVNVEQSRRMVARLKEQGVRCDYLEVDGEGHGLSKPGTLPKFQAGVGKFLNEWLAGK